MKLIALAVASLLAAIILGWILGSHRGEAGCEVPMFFRGQ